MNATVITRILAICGDVPSVEKHRHYLEQLPAMQLQRRLEDLEASEKKHAGRWYGGGDIVQPDLNRSRMGMVATV